MPTAFRHSHLKINTLQSTFKQHISTTAFFNAPTDKKQASSSDYSEEKFTGIILPAIPESQSQEKPREKPVWP